MALKRLAGLFFIGNVKTCAKYFCKADLKAECADYERDKSVVLKKKLELVRDENVINDDGVRYGVEVHRQHGSYVRAHWRHQCGGK